MALRPPKIKHVHYRHSDSFEKIASLAAAALHMGKGERALLSFYAACSSGFRPSLQAIANATGQNRSQVWRNRNALIEHGIAAEQNDVLVIDWNRLRMFASLDPKMTSKRCICAPLDLDPTRLSICEFECAPMPDLLARLSSMTDKEYADLRTRLRSASARRAHSASFARPGRRALIGDIAPSLGGAA